MMLSAYVLVAFVEGADESIVSFFLLRVKLRAWLEASEAVEMACRMMRNAE